MSFKLTDEQLMIQSMVREFSRKVVAETAAERDKTKEFPAKNLKQMAELGLLGMMVPFDYEGSDSDTVGYVLALSEIAYSCASTAVVMSVHNSIVCESILNYGSEDQKQHYLKELAMGKYIGAFALTEPEAGSDPVSQQTTAVKDGDHYIINGTKRFITTGKNCGLVIVTAKTDPDARHKGISAFIVTKDNPGLKVGHMEDKMGLRASDTTDLHFEECRVPASDMLGNAGEGFKIVMKGLDGGRIGIAAQSLGVAQAAFDAAVKYAKQRDQFGQKISKFQGLALDHRRYGHRDRGGPATHPVRGRHEGPQGALHPPGFHGQTVRVRNGQPGYGQGTADAWRIRFYHRLSGGTFLPGRPCVHHLRRHVGNPAGGDLQQHLEG